MFTSGTIFCRIGWFLDSHSTQDLFPHKRPVQARQEEEIFSLMRTHYPWVRKQNGWTNQIIQVLGFYLRLLCPSGRHVPANLQKGKLMLAVTWKILEDVDAVKAVMPVSDNIHARINQTTSTKFKWILTRRASPNDMHANAQQNSSNISYQATVIKL